VATKAGPRKGVAAGQRKGVPRTTQQRCRGEPTDHAKRLVDAITGAESAIKAGGSSLPTIARPPRNSAIPASFQSTTAKAKMPDAAVAAIVRRFTQNAARLLVPEMPEVSEGSHCGIFPTSLQ